MANQNQNGRNVALPDENRASWRPQDQSYRWRSDDDRWREREDRDEDRYSDRQQRWGRDSRIGHWADDRDDIYRSSERYGQGQSGYTAGRYADDRSMGFAARNAGYTGGYEDRRMMTTDDRFTGRGQGYWLDRSERWGYNPERWDRWSHNPERYAYGAGPGGGWRGYEDPEGYGPYGAQPWGYGPGHHEPRHGQYSQGWYGPGYGAHYYGYGPGPYEPRYGQGWSGYGQSSRWQGYGHEARYGHEPRHGEPRYGHSWGYGQDAGRGRSREGWSHSFRGKGPQGYTRSDERIRESVCEALADDDAIDATHIEVTVRNGEVVLGGSVEDRYSKRTAEDVVERVLGVRDVQNQIKVLERRGNQGSSQTVGRSDVDSSLDKRHRV